MKKVIMLFIAIISLTITVNATRKLKHVNSVFPGPVITGIQSTTPFITAGANVIANISNGPGMLEVPAYNANGIIFGSKAAGVPGFAADGTAASYTTANVKGEWVQFAISPYAGASLNITGFSISGTTSSASTSNKYVVAYALGDTSLFTKDSCIYLDSAGIAGNNPATIPGYLVSAAFDSAQNITVNNGNTLYIRVYLWRKNAASSSAQFTITNFVINGSSTSNSGGTPTSSTTKANICYGNSYLFNGNTYTTSGTYVYHLTNKSGADSAATLMLTVSAKPKVDSSSVVGCNAVLYNNVTYTADTLLYDTIRTTSTLNCDSIYKITNIIISCSPSITSFSPYIAKTGDTVLIKGINLDSTKAVTFGDTTAAYYIVVNDSTIKAVVGNGASGSVSVTTPNGSFSLANFTYKSGNTTGLIVTGLQVISPFITSGSNVVTSISNGTGIVQIPKDSVTGIIFGTKASGIPGWAADGTSASFTTAENKGEWVQLTVTPAKGYNATITGFNITGDNSSLSTADYYVIAYAVGDTSLFGSGTCNFLNPAGATGNNLANTSSDLLNDSIALGQNISLTDSTPLYIRVYMWRKNTASSSAQLAISNLTISGNTYIASGGTPTTSVTNASISAGTYSFNGTAYSAAGTYTFHLVNTAGADSAAILHLTINPGLTDCNSVTHNSITYYTSIVLKDTIKNTMGADSVFDVVIITINPSVFGNIITPKLLSVPSVITTLSDSSNIINIGNGNFGFNCLTAGSNYTLKLSKNNDVNKTNGVTSLDIALLQSHILQKSILSSPYKIIAGDVNGDGKLTALDIVYMKRLILGIDTTFTNTTTGEKRLWEFVDSSFIFSNPTNPFPHKDSIVYSGLNISKNNQTFIGCKLGDVNLDWNPAVSRPSNSPVNVVVLSYEAVKSTSGNLIRIPIKVSNFKDMMGMQFTINFDVDVLRWNNISNNILGIDLGTNHADEGKLTFLWNDPNNNIKTLDDGTVIMELVFEKIGLNTMNFLSLDGSITAVEAFDKDYQLHGIVLNAAKINATELEEQWVVTPNPVSNHVIKVQMNLKEQKTILFKLTDNNGRTLLEQKKECTVGNNNIVLTENKLLPAGVYYIVVNGVEGDVVKKVIIK